MKKVLGIIIIAAAALTAAAFGYKTAPSVPYAFIAPSIPINADRFLELPRFRLSASATSTKIEGNIVAGVVNHHVLASDLLARFFKTLHAARPDVTRIILLSPDHYKRGADTISVFGKDFLTQGGLIKGDREVTDALIQRGLTRADRGLVEGEHGIGALVPFLAREYPDVRLVPIVIRADVSRQEAAEFGRRLAPFVDERTVVVVSSDMSHYLPEQQARINDTKTLAWLETRDRAAMAKADDDYTDNGPSFVALFALLEERKLAPAFTLIDHSISSRYVKDKTNTTSYINGFWSVK